MFTFLTLPHLDDYDIGAGGEEEPPLTRAFEGEKRRTAASTPPDGDAKSSGGAMPARLDAEIALQAKLRYLRRCNIRGADAAACCEALLQKSAAPDASETEREEAAFEALRLFLAQSAARDGAWPPLKSDLYVRIYCRIVTVQAALWTEVVDAKAKQSSGWEAHVMRSLLWRTLEPALDSQPFPGAVDTAAFFVHLRDDVFGAAANGALRTAVANELSLGGTARATPAREICDTVAYLVSDVFPRLSEEYFAGRRGAAVQRARLDGRLRGLNTRQDCADELWATPQGEGAQR